MAYKIKFSPPAEKYVKKIKDNALKALIKNKLEPLKINPYIGDSKTGDLAGFYSVDFVYNKTNYRIAYAIYDDTLVVVVVLVGTRENFYNELKKYIKR